MRILLADDHRMFRDGIRPFLATLSAETQLFEAGTFDEAISVATDAGDIDLAVLGQTMPGMDGAAGIQAFCQRFPATRVVLLTAVADPHLILAAITAGARGILPNTISGDNMLNALRMVASGEVYVPSDAVIALAKMLHCGCPPNRSAGRTNVQTVIFSAGEELVVPLLLNGLPNKLIAQQLDIDEAAVKARLRSIYKKMKVTNRAQAVMALLSVGKAGSVPIVR